MFAFIPGGIRAAGQPAADRFTGGQGCCDLGIPRDALDRQLSHALRLPGETERALMVGRSGCRVWRTTPAPVGLLERHLDPDLFVDHLPSGKVEGAWLVVNHRGSSGIGKAAALMIAAAGAKVVICARVGSELAATKKEITRRRRRVPRHVVDLADVSPSPRRLRAARAGL